MEKISEFLQSPEWRKFQEAVGRRTFCIAGDNFYAGIIEHKLLVVGKYFYVPRGPVMQVQSSKFKVQSFFDEIINLAKKEKAGWIRIEPADDNLLNSLRHWMSKCGYKIKKAPHDMQPREIFAIDITKPEEELLAEMKSKTRYNIKIAQKHGVSLRITNLYETTNSKDIEEFLRLVKITAERDKITPHPESYYRQMLGTIPAENLKLYVAEYEGKVIAANSIIYYGNTATYLHGASDNEHRNVMAPYLLQWQAIKDAKAAGLTEYDFGGISANYEFYETTKKWRGITKFKLGFSPSTKPVEFPGSYDIVINHVKYNLYRIIQKIKSFV